MDNYKIEVKDEAESKEAQELFFELGYSWLCCGKYYNRIGNYTFITAYPDEMLLRMGWGGDTDKELTLPQLRDLVAQSKSNLREYLDSNDNYKLCLINPSEAAHWMIEVPEGAEFYMQMRVGLKVGSQFFFKFDDEDLRVLLGSGWQHASYDSIQEYVDEGDQLLWSRETVKKDPTLISGADAKLVEQAKKFITSDHLNRFEAAEAHLEGHPVQFMLANGDFIDITSDTTLGIFEKDGGYSFRLKPQTIKLELELPKPFEPEEGEKYWWINPNAKLGYEWDTNDLERTDFNRIAMSVWRTEDEIKQVVEQLRKIRGTNS